MYNANKTEEILNWLSVIRKPVRFSMTLKRFGTSVSNMVTHIVQKICTTTAVTFGDCIINDSYRANLLRTCGR